MQLELIYSVKFYDPKQTISGGCLVIEGVAASRQLIFYKI
jgi:hypothetical protein